MQIHIAYPYRTLTQGSWGGANSGHAYLSRSMYIYLSIYISISIYICIHLYVCI